jgi:hypothetical protein
VAKHSQKFEWKEEIVVFLSDSNDSGNENLYRFIQKLAYLLVVIE